MRRVHAQPFIGWVVDLSMFHKRLTAKQLKGPPLLTSAARARAPAETRSHGVGLLDYQMFAALSLV